MKRGRYETIEELKLYCPDSVYNAIDWAEDTINYEIGTYGKLSDDTGRQLYTSVLAYIDLGDLYDKQILGNGKDANGDYYNDIDVRMIYSLPKQYTRNTEAVALSSLLHIIHKMLPEVHGESIYALTYIKADLCQQKGMDYDYWSSQTTVTFEPLEHLTGKSACPEYMCRLIEDKLINIKDDLYLDMHCTWDYSHHSEGLDYAYDKNEYPCVDIYSIHSNSIALAKSILESVTVEEMQAYKTEYENSLKEMRLPESSSVETMEIENQDITEQEDYSDGYENMEYDESTYVTDEYGREICEESYETEDSQSDYDDTDMDCDDYEYYNRINEMLNRGEITCDDGHCL